MESRPSALRKRFYPAQWKKLQAAGLEALVASRGLRLEWIGWDRSLPRLYLPLEGLSRLMTEALDAVASEVARGPMVREGVRPISLRISSQRSGLAGNLILVIEHDQWNCRLAGQAALNSPSLLTSVEMRMDRVRRQVMSLGGTVSFNAVAGGELACESLCRSTNRADWSKPGWINNLPAKPMALPMIRRFIYSSSPTKRIGTATPGRRRTLAVVD